MIFVALSFLLGIANFAMHKAVIESGHPFVKDSKLYFGRHFGKHGSYVLEFVILVGALVFCYRRIMDRADCVWFLYRAQHDGSVAFIVGPCLTTSCFRSSAAV